MKKIKFLRKLKFLYQKSYFSRRDLEVPESNQGGPQGHLTTWWQGSLQAAPAHGVGPTGPPTCSLLFPCLPLARKITPGYLKLVFLLLISCDFDLHIQRISAAEIWCISSPVCDSSEYPSGILFNDVYMKYFAVVDILFSEFECLF